MRVKFDIKERTSCFAIEIVRFVRCFPKDVSGFTLGKQLLRSGTSIGANMQEADAAVSRKDFFHKISISRKEAKETHYWLTVIAKSQMIAEPNLNKLKYLTTESDELVRILSSIFSKQNKPTNNDQYPINK